MIKLIVSDVDGTLVPDGSPDLDPEVFDIILKLREKGMQFVVASGRPWASVESAFEPVKKKIFYVANNGAYVGCHGRCLYAYTMERELAHRIIRKVRMHPELEMVYAGVNGDYLDSKDDTLCDWLTNGYKFNVIRVKDVLELEEPCVKISIYKKEGIEAETMAIGDQLNDIEMLNQAYYSFAVANAREEVRKAARFQADSNVRGGVLKILKGLL